MPGADDRSLAVDALPRGRHDKGRRVGHLRRGALRQRRRARGCLGGGHHASAEEGQAGDALCGESSLFGPLFFFLLFFFASLFSNFSRSHSFSFSLPPLFSVPSHFLDRPCPTSTSSRGGAAGPAGAASGSLARPRGPCPWSTRSGSPLAPLPPLLRALFLLPPLLPCFRALHRRQ